MNTMIKEFYRGPLVFPYHAGELKKLLSRFPDAEDITFCNEARFGSCFYFLLNDVVIRHSVSKYESGDEWATEVNFYGNPDNIERVERRIKNGIEKILETQDKLDSVKRELEELVL